MLQRVTGSQWRLAKGALRLTASCCRSTSSSPSPSPNRTLPKIDDFECCTSYFAHVLSTFYGCPLKTLSGLDTGAESKPEFGVKSEPESSAFKAEPPPSELEWEFLSTQMSFTKPMLSRAARKEEESPPEKISKKKLHQVKVSRRSLGTISTVAMLDSFVLKTISGLDVKILLSYIKYLAWQGRKLDSPQAISALGCVRPPDLETLRADPALEADVLSAIEGLTAAAAEGLELIEVDNKARMASLAALGRTTQWRQALERARSELQSPSKLAARTMSAIAEAAVDDGDYDAALDIMDDPRFHLNHSPIRNYNSEQHHQIIDPVVHKWLERSRRLAEDGGGDNVAEKLLEYLFKIGYIPSESVFEGMRIFAKNRGKVCRKVDISSPGTCKRCSARLRLNRHVTASETGVLFDAFWRMVTAGNSFRRSNPAELRKYQNFLSRLGPRGLCDDDGRGSLVIDGLNVSIGGSGGPRGKGCSKSQQSANLLNMVKFARGSYRSLSRVVVVHRTNDLRRYKDQDEIRASSDVLELDGITEDDPFVMLTALHLGPGARILSNDVMRQHHFALSSLTENGAELMDTFTRWQFGAQCMHQASRSGQKSIMPPLAYDVCVQPLPDQCGAWLVPKVPVLDASVERDNKAFRIPDSWMCIGCKFADGGGKN